MKSARVLSIATLMSVAGAAFAGGGPVHYPGDFLFVPGDRAKPVDRAQIVAELREAQRLGLISLGEADSNIRAPQPVSTKTRAQVVAELREAQRLGLVNVGGEGDIPIATAAQERMIVAAGLRAVEQSKLAAR